MKKRQLKKLSSFRPKEKYFLNNDQEIYSFGNNDKIPENSIVIGYYDDDSSDGEGHGFRDIIKVWFDEKPKHCSLKDIEWDFHVGKIISDEMMNEYRLNKNIFLQDILLKIYLVKSKDLLILL